MLPRPAAVVEDVLVVAAGFFQGVGKKGHVGEAAVVVNGLGTFWDRGFVPGKPCWVEGDGAEGVAHNLSQQGTMGNKLGSISPFNCPSELFRSQVGSSVCCF